MSFGSFLSHGGRPTNGRKRKGVDEYAAQNQDFTARSVIRDGQTVRILVCRFCCQSIGARSDRIKEHLGSNRHQKSKLEAFRKAAENGKDLLSQEDSDSVPPGLLHLPEPPIVMVKYPGKTLEFSGSSPAGPHSNCSTSATHLNTSSSSGSLSFGGAGEIPKSKDLNSSSSNNSNRVPTAVPPHQLLCVKWSNFESNIISMFAKLRSAEQFVDATLWCEGKTIKCHKMILSACSTYFEKLFTENPNPHPIIFLTEMRFWEISALVEFMYRGEVSIHKENLQSLLKAAVSLQIKGLGCSSENDGDTADDVGVSQSAPGTPGDSLLNLNDNSRVDLNTTPSNSSSGGASLSLSQQYLLDSMNMGMKNIMNNRTSTPLGFNNSNNLTSNNSLIKSSSAPKVKRRKKKTPERIYFPRTALPLPLFNDSMAAQGQQQQVQVREAEKEVVDMPMMDMRESEEPGNCSDDSMVAHERNKVDVVNKAERGSYHHPEMTYKVEEKHCEKNDQMDEEQTDRKEVAGEGGGGRGSVIVGGDDRKGHPGTGDEEYSENTLTADESGAVVLIRNTSIVSPAAAEWERLEQKWWYKNNNNNSK